MKKIDGYYVTETARLRFRKWLLVNKLTVNKFAKGCGCSRQYIERVLKGETKVTPSVLEHFKKGGYETL